MITFNISEEDIIDEKGNRIEGKQKVLWLVFKNDDGSTAIINLNNLANEKSGVIRNAMRKAIANYIESNNVYGRMK